ncbi:hypothetical protein [Parasitella parasitica]|uniref:WHIM1 domain-containing protein n=1 Tax=Parasitella parasitica TaxID=35722 RepID=A0A0B7NCR1_9FUNG|nr:hypothetical protein [Parasitella parasitica]
MSDITTTTHEDKPDTPSYEFSSSQQWQIGFIYAFTATFNHHEDMSILYHRLPNFTPQDLEDEIQKEESELIHQIICACLGNVLNRSKPIESFKVSLQQLLTDKIKAFEIDLQVNPLLRQSYYSLPVDQKLYILYSMIEWQLQDSTAVKTMIDGFYQQNGQSGSNPIISHPIGRDGQKRTYWQFGESSWIWRQTNSTKLLDQWKTVCKNRQDIEQLVESFSGTKSRAEKALVKVIEERIYDIANKEEQKKLRKERAELRKLVPVEVSITPTTLRSRGNRSQRVHYNFDDIYGIDEEENNEADDDSFEDEYDAADLTNGRKRQRSRRAPSPPRPPPTRWSSRLNRGTATEISAETVEIDGQSVEAAPSEQSSSMMGISGLRSALDTTSSGSNGVMSVNNILNSRPIHD